MIYCHTYIKSLSLSPSRSPYELYTACYFNFRASAHSAAVDNIGELGEKDQELLRSLLDGIDKSWNSSMWSQFKYDLKHFLGIFGTISASTKTSSGRLGQRTTKTGHFVLNPSCPRAARMLTGETVGDAHNSSALDSSDSRSVFSPLSMVR